MSKVLNEELGGGSLSLRLKTIKTMSSSKFENLYAHAKHSVENKTVSKDFIKEVELRFDNLCNLQCRMCHPSFSHKWMNDNSKYEDIQKLFPGDKTTKEDFELPVSIIDEVVKLAPTLEKIIISGGEAMYSRKHYEFLERIQDLADNISLFYPTNLNLLKFKSWDAIELWKKFKHVSLRASIDGHSQQMYEYIRPGGSLEAVEKNIKIIQQHPNIRIFSAITVSILNIFDLGKTMIYLNKLGLNVDIALVNLPEQLCIQVLPPALKKEITVAWNKLLEISIDEPYYKNLQEQGSSVINYMNSRDISHKWSDAKEYCNIQDIHFNTNILDIIPQFRNYW